MNKKNVIFLAGVVTATLVVLGTVAALAYKKKVDEELDSLFEDFDVDDLNEGEDEDTDTSILTEE